MATDVSFKGVFPILVTPFDGKEIVDLESFVRVVRFMAEIGVDGVTILGVLGESNRMVDSEREELIVAAVAAADGRIPVVVGTSHKGTQATLYLSMMAESLGASAVMMTPSKEAVPNEERIFEYFRKVANEINIPIVLQDHPGSTEVHMSAPLILRMVNEIPRIACIKQEAPPTPAKIAALISGMKDRRVPVLTGLGALYGMFDLERGSDGYMTGFAFPEVLIAMVKAVRDGPDGGCVGAVPPLPPPDRVRAAAGDRHPQGDLPAAGTHPEQPGAPPRRAAGRVRGRTAPVGDRPRPPRRGHHQAAGALNRTPFLGRRVR